MTHLVRADNEWRFDLMDEAYTLVARNRRTLAPLEVKRSASEQALRARFACPFCAGEALPSLDRVAGASGREVVALPSPTPFGFVEHEPPPMRAFAAGGALGAHEILVATDPALHDSAVVDLDEETLSLFLLAFCRRRADLAGDARLGGVALAVAPATLSRLPHMHASLLAVPFPARRFSSVETCPACREVTDARARGRVVTEADGVCAYVPFAPRCNVHVRIASQAHGTSLLSADHAEEHSADVARVLKDVIARVVRVAPGAELLLRVSPMPLADGNDGRDGHLLLELESLFDVDATVASGLGLRVVTVPPEDLAEQLRSA